MQESEKQAENQIENQATQQATDTSLKPATNHSPAKAQAQAQSTLSFFDMVSAADPTVVDAPPQDQPIFAQALRPNAAQLAEHSQTERLEIAQPNQATAAIADISADDMDEKNEVNETTQHNLGQMPHEARRVIIYLMRHGTILLSENSTLFELLCRYQHAIRGYLAEIYIQLILDAKQGVGYIVHADATQDETLQEVYGDEIPSLIRKRTLTLYDSLVLLILRRYYQERERTGEQRIMIDFDRIQAQLIPFIPITNHDSKDRKKLSGSLEKFVEKKILTASRAEEGRYLITPIIRYVVNAEVLQSLLNEYTQMAAQTQPIASAQNTGAAQ